MKVVIVGSGPAGLFAAYKLVGHADVTVVDKGGDVDSRACPSPGECKAACKPCNILCGVGGAGLFSDGKIIFSTKIGNNLNPVVNEAKNMALVKEVVDIFSKYDVNVEKLSQESEREIEHLKKKARIVGGDFLYAPQAHIGTDKLLDLISCFKKDLESKGVKFLNKTEVLKVEDKEIVTNKESLQYDKLILAPGRVGAGWLEQVMNDLKLEYSYNPIDIGVRVEVPKEITDSTTKVVRDMKFYLRSDTYNDLVRTFCTCPGGKVTRETHEGFNLVNGHSDSDDSSPNTNFAFLVTMPLTAPLSNTNYYGHKVADLAYVTGVKKPILQRLGDLRSGHRSHFEKKHEFLINPTLNDVVYGDIGLVLPHRVTLDIIEGLEKLDRIIPGVANDETLLYAPEIKFHGLKVITDEYLATSRKNIYVAGDGAGLSRGIGGAACCGLLAAEGILKEAYKSKR
ncbi:FAD-dependent oxidoreductase [Candidatus Woesearchaeota archaeon]|nr:FAD-dependent oxidoreductase [Candidatus Woesearchaeota archaeon]